MGEDAIPGSSTPSFLGFVQSGQYGLLPDVSGESKAIAVCQSAERVGVRLSSRGMASVPWSSVRRPEASIACWASSAWPVLPLVSQLVLEFVVANADECFWVADMGRFGCRVSLV